MKLYYLHLPSKSVDLYVECSGNDIDGVGEFCGSYTAELSTTGDVLWTTDSYDHAQFVASCKTEWYNSCLHTPVNPYCKESIEVREITL